MKKLIEKYEEDYPQIKKAHKYLVECLINCEINEFSDKEEMLKWIEEVRQKYGQLLGVEIIFKDKEGNVIKTLNTI